MSSWINVPNTFIKKDLRLVEDWMKSLCDWKLVATVAIHLSKVFDSLPHSLLITKLRAHGLEHSSYTFYRIILQGDFSRR